MLRHDAPPEALAALGRDLRALWQEDGACFRRLFDPVQPHQPTRLPPARADLYRDFGLIETTDAGHVGAHRIRVIGALPLVMELGEGVEYHQDIWPETDALLSVLEGAPRDASVLDVGTGTGIVAIRAAVAGHEVVATDLYSSALMLARFNAALSGVAGRIEFRQGHLFEPVRDRQFDLVLAAPHYTRVNDQLRLEALRSGPPHVKAGGRFVCATFLEWEGRDGVLAAVDAVLRPIASSGYRVRVVPLESPLKQEWFHAALSDPPIPGLCSRHRFVITIEPGDGTIEVRRPALEALPRRDHVPLSRLRGANGSLPAAVIAGAEDVDRLRALLAMLRVGIVRLEEPHAGALVDACRFGARRCVNAPATDGAAGAILDPAGRVRPCTAGDPIGTADDTLASLLDKQAARAAETALRRGCAECPATSVCSRCLSPTPLSELEYCDLVREHAAVLGDLPAIFDAVLLLRQIDPSPSQITLKTKRTVELIAARGRPYPAGAGPDAAAESLVAALRARMREIGAWIAVCRRAGRLPQYALIRRIHAGRTAAAIDATTAAMAELIADGATASEVRAHLRGEAAAAGVETRGLERLYAFAAP